MGSYLAMLIETMFVYTVCWLKVSLWVWVAYRQYESISHTNVSIIYTSVDCRLVYYVTSQIYIQMRGKKQH